MLGSKSSSRLKLALVALAGSMVGFGHGQAIKKLLVTDLGLLPGGIRNIPRKVNLDGVAVGYTQKVGSSAAFLYDTGILYDLGVLPGRSNAVANWINRFNLVVGTSGTGALAKGFVWSNGSMTVIPDGDPLRDWPTEGVGINDSAVVAFNVDMSGLVNGSTFKSGAYLQGSTLAFVPPTANFQLMHATAISNLNWMAGIGPKADGTIGAWIWELPAGTNNPAPTEVNVNANPTDIPTVNDLSDISLDGSGDPSMVGSSGPMVKDGNGNPIYHVPSPFVTLGTAVLNPVLLPGDTIGECNGIANDGTIVGRSGKFELRNGIGIYSMQAVVFIPVLPVEPYWQAFPVSDYMPPNSGITIDNLIDINDRGQMVGTYTKAGQIRSVLLTQTITPIAITVANPSLPGGFSTTGNVVIDDNAPFGGVQVKITTNNSIVGVPATVTVPAGLDNVNFTVNSSPVLTMTPVLITAEKDGYKVSTTVRLQPTALNALIVNPTFITGGQKANGTVQLAGTARTGGFKVDLFSSNTSAAIVPASTTVAVGQSTSSFFVYTVAVQTNTPVQIRATAGGITRTANITVATPFLEILSLSLTQCFGGQSVPGYVQISGPARAPGAVVTLGSSSPGVATVPGSVTVLTGTRVASFSVTTVRVRFNTNVTITGTFNTQTRTKTFLVKGAALYSVTVTPTTVVGGTNATGRVTMDWFPFTGGAIVSLTSSNVGVANVPVSVTVPSNNNKVDFQVTTNPVVAPTNITITGQYLGVTKTGTLTVTP